MMLTRNIYKYLSIPVGVILVFFFRIAPGICFILSLASIFTLGIKFFAKENKRFLIGAFLAALIIRMAVAFFFYTYTNAVSDGYFASDEKFVYRRAVDIAEYGYGDAVGKGKSMFYELTSGAVFGVNIYTHLLTMLIAIFGKSLLMVKFLSSLVGSVTIIGIFLLAKEIFNTRIAKISAITAAFFPSLVIWSSAGLKEPFIILFIVYNAYYVVKNIKRFGLFNLANIILSAILLRSFNITAGAVAIIAYIIAVIIYAPLGILVKRAAFIAALCVSIIAFMGSQRLISYHLHNCVDRQALNSDLDDANIPLFPHNRLGEEGLRKYFNDYPSHFVFPSYVYTDESFNPKEMYYSCKVKWPGFLVSYLKGMLYAVFSPFLWSINSSNQMMAYPQMVIIYITIPFVMTGIIISLRYYRKSTMPIICFIFLLFSVLAITEGNIGGLFRHRDWASPLLIILFAAGFDRIAFRARHAGGSL